MEQIEFESLPIPEEVLRGICDAGFTHCTPIQSQSLPITLAGRDVAGQGQTGTGKTAAFLISLYSRLLKNKPKPSKGKIISPRALVIAPTRELARQIHKDAILLGKYCDFKVVCIFGGMDYQKQKDEIAGGVDLLIVTPGRLIDYYKQKLFSLSSIEALVIDEADRMFDMGFIADLRYIMRKCSPYDQRLSMLFSATLSFRAMELAYEHMNNPAQIKINPEQPVTELVEQSLYHVGSDEKLSLLLGILKKEEGKKIIIFCNTKHQSEKLDRKLRYNGHSVGQISGDLHQKKRIQVLDGFHEGKINILIATDVASRGLHIDGITHVINYDLPQDAEDYIHRIGRTARAGEVGKAIALACEDFAVSLERIEETLKFKIPVEWPDEDLFLKEKEGSPPYKPKPKFAGNKSSKSSNSKKSSRPRRTSGNRPRRKPTSSS
ncbi:MAG: DEAD/DEAH box helicase [Nitrospinales bacterium]